MSPESFVPASAARVAARLSRVVELGLAKCDLTLAQYRTLSVLADGEAAASKMADHLSVSRPSVTAVVDGLVARGLVQRRHDEQDRRKVGHTITAEGRARLVQADAALQAVLLDILDHAVNPTECRAALDGLAVWEGVLDRFRQARRAAKANGVG